VTFFCVVEILSLSSSDGDETVFIKLSVFYIRLEQKLILVLFVACVRKKKKKLIISSLLFLVSAYLLLLLLRER